MPNDVSSESGLRAHPDVLQVCWGIYAKAKRWDVCLEIARTLTHMEPDKPGRMDGVRSRPNDSATRRTRAFDCNLDAMAGFAAHSQAECVSSQSSIRAKV